MFKNALIAAALLLSLTACDPDRPPAATQSTAHAVPDTQQPVETAATESEAPTTTLGDAAINVEPTASGGSTPALPADSLDFYKRLEKFSKAYELRSIDDYDYGFNQAAKFEDKYPLFDDLDCTYDEGKKNIWCAYGRTGEVDEAELAKQIPYLSNRDVLLPTLRCTTVCINTESRLVGAVQPAMVTWLKEHCPNTAIGRSCRSS